MASNPRQRDPAEPRSGTDDFFIPDLCAPRPLFLTTLLAELAVLLHLLGQASLSAFDWVSLGRLSFFVQWILLLSAALLCASRTALARLPAPLVTALCLGLVAAVTAASSLVLSLPALGLLAPAGDGWLLRNVIVAVLLAAVGLRYLYLQQELVTQQRAGVQARLEALLARMRPHFLFNALNSIASLIEGRPRQAERAVEDLAALLRVALRERPGETTLADELELCERYLAIEQLRLGHRLRIDWTVDPRARACPMPTLLLQPLVENAVYHGIAGLPEGGTITLRAQLRGDATLRLELRNPEPEVAPPQGARVALDLIRQRLEAIYGRAGSLATGREGGQFVVTLTVPVARIG